MHATKPLKLLIVGSDIQAPGSQSLKKAAGVLGIDADIALVNEPDIAARVQDADHVIYRLRPKSYGLFQALAGRLAGPKADALSAMLAAFDKFRTYEILSRHDIPTPKSRLIKSNDTIETYPVVAKILNGNQGIGVSLLHSNEDFEAFKANFPAEENILLQDFIEESKGTDIRLFVVGNQVVAAMRRVAETGDFRANLHLGARMDRYVPSDEEVALGVRAVGAFRLPFAGVDIISSNKGPLVLEVNPSPGFGIQEVSDRDVALEVVKGVLND